ncbi:hypothetical protein N7449_002098 [Penicillium cf. viridicatum]|uniref:Uncharacterized protein n=1 Tax=Penicillium cf. viridicatum TaxID=2972119 RepID=A0A9W9MUC9_9EURO|nr:hypothetical protein N7449_002098 [Penicillium cf. viridicatum]
MVRSSTNYIYDALELESSPEYGGQRECDRAEWPFLKNSDGNRLIRRAIVIGVYIVLGIGALNIIAIIAIFVTLLVKYNAAPASDFQFYKNTRFEECAAVVTDAANCTAIMTAWNNWSKNSHYLSEISYTSNGISYDWCQTVSCFNGYKVVPSLVNDSAIVPTALSGWWCIICTCVSAMWTLRKTSPWFQRDRQPKPCRGIRELGVFDWIFLIWDPGRPLGDILAQFDCIRTRAFWTEFLG